MKLCWYFDFISPFAYIQLKQFERLPSNVEIEFKPILLAGLLNHWQNVGPAEIAPKRIFTYKHCYWKAKSLGIQFNMPPAHPFNSLMALRLAIAMNCSSQAITCIFDAIWKLGYSLEGEECIQFLQNSLKNNDILSLVSNDDIKQKLKENTEQAASIGVWGVPTFVVEEYKNELFWGLDSFDMLLDFVNEPKAFKDEQMLKIESLPEGIQRKR
ncbi:2-hydroxychromene-2-carboxylate isomerase [Aliikangiella sp. G2MR2-5]|uniref:2-hydroxychromene-2-carboxylate isomerase n=1 Tax=Aliikangiella sp. G2MR2-5 TaxID=2788943 RepID=UPI0018AC5667|nr:2-hydroxychromene-2-carboxylate isomerase [Aliikangiella sp. G2MR2-5]